MLNNNDRINFLTLVGMMGSGKTKFGYLVAKKLNYNFYDIDSMIEKKTALSIVEIFNSHGEQFFRNIEKKEIENVIIHINKKQEKAILSIGGGGFDIESSRKLLLKNSNVVWLNTPINTIVERVGDAKKRPMIKGNKLKSLNTLFEKRKHFFSLAHNKIDTNELTQNQIINKIINIIHK